MTNETSSTIEFGMLTGFVTDTGPKREAHAPVVDARVDLYGRRTRRNTKVRRTSRKTYFSRPKPTREGATGSTIWNPATTGQAVMHSLPKGME